MDFSLSDDQQAFVSTARAFSNDVLAPGAALWDRDHIFPVEVFRQAGDLGFMSLYAPEETGGLNLSRLDASLIFEELAQGCTSTTAFMTIHNMATNMIGRYGRQELLDQWGAELTSGQKLASYCLTEPGSGSDAASLTTSAKIVDGHYVVNGSKVFISGAGATDILIVMVRTGGKGPKGITALAIPADSANIHYGKAEDKMGWHCQPTRQITFDDVKVPVGNRLGAEGQGFKMAMEALDGGRINIASCSVGTAQAALNHAITYSRDREQFGQSIAEFQVTQFKLADMATELVAARQMVRLAAWKLDNNEPEAGVYCSMAKRLATDLCFNICNEALQIHGGYGYIREYPLERFVRDTRVHQILEGTNEIMRMIISRRLLMDDVAELIR
ncbi:acyl-CoA dehydrogenase family protein [Endozoicomonas euniceicola]|uniref:Acyl-CoA dehydrogenase family protein n=1 Tax=Endozoicomonas euniceicola TaxID=1234143 RepID=A0ABY6GSY1_9GAMM|nr:acyl-CoA dehydrogenase family protein [Endozoicomonas euniceicola]UYM15863.1 acyl-CoA dehydrogenase family protein [Endozoicomonas euniceicola]